MLRIIFVVVFVHNVISQEAKKNETIQTRK